ncbi:MAG: methyltransferase domain-containing protein [Xanthobacteraceae bacterium]
MSLRRRVQANSTFRRLAKGVHNALPFGLRRLTFTLWNTDILGRARYAGVYKSFDAFPNQSYPPIDTETVRASLAAMKRDDASGLMIFRHDHAMLPVVAAMLGGRDLRVLDFGGAAGLDYVGLRAAVGGIAHYCVVELPEICQVARDAWAARTDGDHLVFREDMPPTSERFDIVYAWSAIHYVRQPLELLASFAAYQPRAILLVYHAITRELHGFVRGQRGEHYVCPQHVLSLRDIERALPGYRLAFRGSGDFEMNVDNFPPGCRVGRCANLLFLPT